MTDRTPTVTAVVLNYDGRHLLEVILPSLAAQTYAQLEVLVVDNGSRDDSLAYLEKQWPAVEVLAIPDNIGVAAALNRGVAAASRGRYLALLNNDVELEPDWVALLAEALDRHPRSAAVAGKLLRYHQREVLDGAGDVLTRSLAAYSRGAGELDRGQYEQEEEVFAPTAGAALYRASALAQVGPFDESFFAYFEDVDWGLRAQLAGLRSWYVPTAVAYHMGSATTKGQQNPFYYALQRRNLLGILVKDLPGRFLLRHAPTLLRRQLGAVLDSARAGMLGAHMHGLGGALCRLPAWWRARREIQSSRQISSRQLESILPD